MLNQYVLTDISKIEYAVTQDKHGLPGVSAVVSAKSAGDEYHTMDQLYDHRVMLFLALIKALPTNRSWKKKVDSDWFIAGIELPDGQVTYHCAMKYWHLCVAPEEDGPQFDGHTSPDVLDRLIGFIATEDFV